MELLMLSQKTSFYSYKYINYEPILFIPNNHLIKIIFIIIISNKL